MGLDDDHRIAYWWERIVLPTVDMNEHDNEMLDDADESDVDVPVKRRQ